MGADDAVRAVVDAMPLLRMPTSERRTLYTPSEPLDFYGDDGKLHANGEEFHIKGINWYGTEGKLMMLEGLDVKPIGKIFDFLVVHDFNAMPAVQYARLARRPPIPQGHFCAAQPRDGRVELQADVATGHQPQRGVDLGDAWCHAGRHYPMDPR